MSHVLSSLDFILGPDIGPFLRFDGAVLSMEDISTLKEILSFAEDRLREKPQSGARLFQYLYGYGVTWRDGEQRMVRHFPMSSTFKDSLLKSSRGPGKRSERVPGLDRKSRRTLSGTLA